MIEGLKDTGLKYAGLNESGWKEVEPNFWAIKFQINYILKKVVLDCVYP